MEHVNNPSGTDKNGKTLDIETTRRILRKTAEDIPAVSPAVFARIEQTLDKAAPEKLDPEILPLQGLFNWFRNYVGRPQVAWGVVAVQAIAICFFLSFLPLTNQNTYQTLSTGNSGVLSREGVRFYVIFADNAKMSEIGNLFSGLNVAIAIGSGQKGIYTIKIVSSTSSETEELVTTLKTSPLIKFMEKAY